MPVTLRALCTFPLIALLCTGCEPATPVTPDEDGVPCVGLPETKRALLDATHPFIYRGEVRALQAEKKKQGASILDLWLPEAHAYALEEERPVVGARVTLSYLDPISLERTGQPVPYHATTDAQGRFCIVAPTIPPDGALVMLGAQKGELELEQLATHSFDSDLNAVSSAVSALALDHVKKTGAPLSAARWLNLRTLADTRVGLLSPVDASAFTSHTELVEHITHTLRDDPEIAALLATK